jgi:hypothetical protein
MLTDFIRIHGMRQLGQSNDCSPSRRKSLTTPSPAAPRRRPSFCHRMMQYLLPAQYAEAALALPYPSGSDRSGQRLLRVDQLALRLGQSRGQRRHRFTGPGHRRPPSPGKIKAHRARLRSLKGLEILASFCQIEMAPVRRIEGSNGKFSARQRAPFIPVHSHQPFRALQQSRREPVRHLRRRSQKSRGHSVRLKHWQDIGGAHNALGIDQVARRRPGVRVLAFQHWRPDRQFRAQAFQPLRTSLDRNRSGRLRPWRSAFLAERAPPCTVFGPVLVSAFVRFVMTLRALVMSVVRGSRFAVDDLTFAVLDLRRGPSPALGTRPDGGQWPQPT